MNELEIKFKQLKYQPHFGSVNFALKTALQLLIRDYS